MKNVTITLDEEVARWARIEAAKADTSLSRMVGEMLREKMRAQAHYREAMHDYLSRPARPLKDPQDKLPIRDRIHER